MSAQSIAFCNIFLSGNSVTDAIDELKGNLIDLPILKSFELDEHINCVENVNQLINKNQIKKIWYQGDKVFEKYTRFMVIGQWYD